MGSAGSSRLSKLARRSIADPANESLVSALRAWRIAHQEKAMGKLDVSDDLIEAIDDAGFVRRPLGFAEHADWNIYPIITTIRSTACSWPTHWRNAARW
jgi:hypothetical protein